MGILAPPKYYSKVYFYISMFPPYLQGRTNFMTSCLIFYVTVDWLVVLSLTAHETVFQSISDRLPERGIKRKERIEESKNVQTTPTRTYCKRNRPLSYYHQNCRTPRHWKFTQDHRTTRPHHSYVMKRVYSFGKNSR